MVQGAGLLGNSVEGWGYQSHPSTAGEVGPSVSGVHKQKWKKEGNRKMIRMFSTAEECVCLTGGSPRACIDPRESLLILYSSRCDPRVSCKGLLVFSVLAC